jgi:hypothetical protein
LYDPQICMQAFDSKADLQSHTQAHMREAKPYKCQHCIKTFANSSYLSQHMRIHLNLKPFGPCQYCGRKVRPHSPPTNTACAPLSSHNSHIYNNIYARTPARNRTNVNRSAVRRPSRNCPIYNRTHAAIRVTNRTSVTGAGCICGI